nr:FUSC family protein [uncultured Desulfobacter sp.]
MPNNHWARLSKELTFSSQIFRHALRAAVAITLAVAVVKQTTLYHALWVPITVLVIMRPSLGGTLHISWKRMAGTAAGAAVGILLAFLELPLVAISILAFGLLFLIFYFKGRNYLVFIAFLTADLVIVLSAAFPHPWQSGAERMLDTLLGIGIGLGVSFVVWPNFARKTLRQAVGDLIAAQYRHFSQLRKAYLSDAPNSVKLLSGRLQARESLDNCTQKCTDAAIEPGLIPGQRQELLNLVDLFAKLHRTLIALSSIVAHSTGVFKGEIEPDFNRLMDTVENQFSQLETYTRTGEDVFSYHAFNDCFSRFMARLGAMRKNGEFDRFPLDARNSSSSFILQIRQIGDGLDQIYAGLKNLRTPQ